MNASNMNHREVKNIDYGWRLNGRSILFYKDRSLAADESTHQMEKALRQMSMEYYALDRCLQCGICSSFCPNNLIKTTDSFSPRNFIQKTRLGLLDLNGDELWMCTNCGHCQMVCPFEIPLLEVMSSLRHLVVEQGAGYVPVSIKSSIASISSCGNPWKEETSSRIKWIQGTETVPPVASTEETVHIFLGCLSGYDRRARKAAEAAMYILQIAKIPFKILSDEEVCCGDSVRRVGDFTTSEKMKKINRTNFLKNNVRKLYVLSPHCLSTFQEMYAKENNHETRITPLLEVVYDLIGKGIIKLNKYQDKRVTFHDPCFFSKHLNIIAQPREILDRMQGIERREMEHSGKKSLCCGGGGGGIWRDAKKGERLSEIRLDEALGTGADIIVTSCPYCLSMLEDARQADEKYRQIEIMDICELVVKGMCDENN
jgi:Fe-S oxidoreductase